MWLNDVQISKGAIANFVTVNYDANALLTLQGGVVCGASLECFNDTFQDASLSSSWVTSRSSGTFTPSPVNGRLRLTQSVTNQATAASFQRLFPGAQNLVTVEFDHLAYGGTGASSYTKGDILVASSGTVLTKLAVGTNGQILRANSAAAAACGPING